MKKGRIKYEFNATVWKYEGQNGWYFVSLPTDISGEIRKNLKSEEKGWGMLKAIACIGSTEWQSAVWFDTKLKTHLLPVKAEIRKKENIQAGDKVKIIIWL